MPGALTEPLFLTDPAEAQIAAGRPGQQVMARSLVRAIQEYFGR
jgi:N-acetylmuramoyl-L-alanine amidase